MFTGTGDTTALAKETLALFNASSATGLSRGLVNRVGATHFEQDDGPQYNALLGLYSVAWTNNFHPPAQLAAAIDWNSLIFGNSSTSVCHGGDGVLADCEMDRGAGSCYARDAHCNVDPSTLVSR